MGIMRSQKEDPTVTARISIRGILWDPKHLPTGEATLSLARAESRGKKIFVGVKLWKKTLAFNMYIPLN